MLRGGGDTVINCGKWLTDCRAVAYEVSCVSFCHLCFCLAAPEGRLGEALALWGFSPKSHSSREFLKS
jgi:hypothetical protein